MFASQKENNPWSGGLGMTFRRLAFRKSSWMICLMVSLLIFIMSFSSPPKLEEHDVGEFEQKLRSIENKDLSFNQREEQLKMLAEQLRTKEQQIREKENEIKLREEILQGGGPVTKSDLQNVAPGGDLGDKSTPIVDPIEPIIEDPLQPVGEDNKHQYYPADKQKQEAVRQALLHAWNGYSRRCWGSDELHPVDGNCNSWMGLGLTIVDSLDTLWIMGLRDEFKRGRDWVADHLSFDKNRDFSLFETTIRILGGLEAAYDLSGDKMFLDKAQQLGDRFLPAFNTRSGIPNGQINLVSGHSKNPSWAGGAILSEAGTLQLEFTYLSEHTHKPIYREKALKVFDKLDEMDKPGGLYPVYINADSGTFARHHITLGALGDSFYEYLLKLWIMTGKDPNSKYRRMYDEALKHIVDQLVKKSSPNQLTYLAEMMGNGLIHKMDHLACFAGAMFVLGAQGETAAQHIEIGKGITHTCYEMYRRMATGIAPELVKFEGSNDFEVSPSASHYLLRPETVESFFVLWRSTHDPIYRTMGWEVFQAINKYCKTEFGFSGIRDVTNTRTSYDNVQQSFFLAETLKYLYLLFSEDDLIPLNKYVFNTEDGPLY